MLYSCPAWATVPLASSLTRPVSFLHRLKPTQKVHWVLYWSVLICAKRAVHVQLTPLWSDTLRLERQDKLKLTDEQYVKDYRPTLDVHARPMSSDVSAKSSSSTLQWDWTIGELAKSNHKILFDTVVQLNSHKTDLRLRKCVEVVVFRVRATCRNRRLQESYAVVVLRKNGVHAELNVKSCQMKRKAEYAERKNKSAKRARTDA